METTQAPEPPSNAAELVPTPPAASPERQMRITVDQLAQLPDSREKTEWINELVRAEVNRLRYAEFKQKAIDAYNSGQFDDLKKLSPQQGIALAIMKLNIGFDWGITPADSLRSIYMVGGRPALENDLVASKLYSAGIAWDPEFTYDEVKDEKGKPWRKCTGCTLWLKRWSPEHKRYLPMMDVNNQEQISVSFTESDADHALIWEGGKQIPLSSKWNFKSWAKDMYYWKCVSRVKKFYAPNVLRGASIREEALLETMPVDAMPPELLPPDLQPTGEASPLEPVMEQPRPSLRDQVLQQESFLDQPAREPGEGE